MILCGHLANNVEVGANNKTENRMSRAFVLWDKCFVTEGCVTLYISLLLLYLSVCVELGLRVNHKPCGILKAAISRPKCQINKHLSVELKGGGLYA